MKRHIGMLFVSKAATELRLTSFYCIQLEARSVLSHLFLAKITPCDLATFLTCQATSFLFFFWAVCATNLAQIDIGPLTGKKKERNARGQTSVEIKK